MGLLWLLLEPKTGCNKWYENHRHGNKGAHIMCPVLSYPRCWPYAQGEEGEWVNISPALTPVTPRALVSLSFLFPLHKQSWFLFQQSKCSSWPHLPKCSSSWILLPKYSLPYFLQPKSSLYLLLLLLPTRSSWIIFLQPMTTSWLPWLQLLPDRKLLSKYNSRHQSVNKYLC